MPGEAGVTLGGVLPMAGQAAVDKEGRGSGCAHPGKGMFYIHWRNYGAWRISLELKEDRNRTPPRAPVDVVKAFKQKTTNSRLNKLAYPNLLKEKASEALSRGEVIVGDITYLALEGGGFCYLAMFQDKLTRRIVGWEIMDRMTEALRVKAPQRHQERD